MNKFKWKKLKPNSIEYISVGEVMTDEEEEDEYEPERNAQKRIIEKREKGKKKDEA